MPPTHLQPGPPRQPAQATAASATIAREVERLLAQAKLAARALSQTSGLARNEFIFHVSRLLRERSETVLQANRRDLDVAAGLAPALRDRLLLTPARIEALSRAAAEIAALPDVLGAIVDGSVRPNGLQVVRQRVPIGVIGIIYEARPNVTIDSALLAIKAGNAVILRGGSEAAHTNAVLAEIVSDALHLAGMPRESAQLVGVRDRALVDALVGRRGGLDLAIPRGGIGLIEAVTAAARVPVIQHFQGVCHVYVDKAADLAMAQAIAINAKTQRPGVCNAMEALLIDAAHASVAVPRLVAALADAGVLVRGCPRTCALSDRPVQAAQDEDYGKEYLDLQCLVAVVDGVEGAIDHIARFGSRHTEAIITGDMVAADRFVAAVDASCVAVNASTRFNDGGELGLGAEIGISTSKLHAYGPMGLAALTAVRFVVRGQGQVRT